MNRRPGLVVAALFALAVAAVAILVAAAHVQPGGHTAPVTHAGRGQGVPTFVLTQPPQPSAGPTDRREPQANPFFAIVLVAGLLAVVAAILILIWVVAGSLRRRRLSLTLRARSRAPEAVPDAVVDLDRAVDRALEELGTGGPVDDAIIRCWLQLETAADAAGVARAVSDTPEEAVGRMLAAGGVHAEPLRRLADLYREARFSRHRMSQTDAEAARAALTSILDDLRQGTVAD